MSEQLAALGEVDEREAIATPTHIACACRPDIAYCGRYSPDAGVEATTFEREPQWCAGCLSVFEGAGCGVCGCRYGAFCRACEVL